MGRLHKRCGITPSSVTLTAHEAEISPTDAEMSAFPSPTAKIVQVFPSDSNDTTAESETDHLTASEDPATLAVSVASS